MLKTSLSGILLIFAATSAAAETMPTPEQADVAWIAEGEFCEPETVLALPDDTLLVSNVCDFREQGNGFLTLLAGNGDVIAWKHVENLDAPLGKTPSHALDGELNIMCSGDETAFAKVKPVLEDLGENVFHLGALGNGHVIKLLNNFFSQNMA